ncbi:MAG TPA: helix-turn-helix domain-containing protein [Fibrobacteria bacterium]|nr:helix-turn-helix domain-containing protein [Fibrobacteria bacterium]
MDERKWPELLESIENLGNISLGCQRMGISRSLYYKLRKLKEIQTDGPSNSKPKRRIHPQAIPDQVKSEIMEIARSNPEWGCQRISYFLELKGTRVSVSTVHALLRKIGLKKRIRKKTG